MLGLRHRPAQQFDLLAAVAAHPRALYGGIAM